MTESEILSAVRKRLGREPDLCLWRLSYGITADDDNDTPRKRYRAGLSVRGGSDIIGILCGKLPVFGRFIALEVKTPEHLARIMSAIKRGATARLSKTDQHQIMFLNVVRAHGGFGAFVDCAEEGGASPAYAALERARKGESE